MAAKKKAVLFLAACLLGLAAYLYHAFCQQDNQEDFYGFSHGNCEGTEQLGGG